jgi:L-ascorbate metabolism protein UlaG (beta-lactamase superfamily)
MMKKNAAAFALIIAMAALNAQEGDPLAVAKGITWCGQNDLRILLAGKIIRVDPAYTTSTEKADIILITHSHQDHMAPNRIKKLRGPDTTVLAGFESFDYQRIEPGKETTVKGIKIKAVPAYNIGTANHMKAVGFCGFVISAGGVTIYVTGDTNRIPEMKSISCDIVLLPLGKIYTMGSLEEAEQAVLDVKAKIAIPVHYGMYEGTQADADAFVSDMKAKGIIAFRLPRSE